MKLNFQHGFYQTRSLIAEAQRCVNLYPEKNPEDAEAPVTCYPTAGLVELGEAPRVGPWRGLYLATSGLGYGVLGRYLYRINPNWTKTQIGTLFDDLSTPVSMVDNGTTMAVVDGSHNGYQVDLTTQAFSFINDPAFYGADFVDYLDTYFLFNRPGTRQFYCSLSNQLTPLDPLYIASKTGFPDPISALIVMHREIWLLGSQKTTEVWFNAGGAQFPFAITPGVFIEHGCIAKYSVQKHDLMIFWLSVDKDGQATVFMGTGYAAKRVSTPAIAAKFSEYTQISDAIGMLYKQQDHVFYQLTFPSVNNGRGATWVVDPTESEWHETVWLDENGKHHRHRANCITQMYGKTVCGDYENGKLYELSPHVYNDAGSPIVRIRGFPHLVNDGRQFSYTRFAADIESGQIPGLTWETHLARPWDAGFDMGFGPLNTAGPPRIWLRVSRDRGRTFETPQGQSLGATGEYLTQPLWRNLGMSRDMVFEVFWSVDGRMAINGAYGDAVPATS